MGWTAVAAISMAVGTGVSALGQIQQGQAAAAEAKSQQAMAEYNAKIQEQEAKMAEQKAGFESRRHAKAAQRQAGSLLALTGASGVVPGVGAPLEIERVQEIESDLERQLITYEGQVSASRSRSQAALDRMQGKVYGQRAKSARTAGYIGAGSTLLTGFSRVAGLYAPVRYKSTKAG